MPTSSSSLANWDGSLFKSKKTQILASSTSWPLLKITSAGSTDQVQGTPISLEETSPLLSEEVEEGFFSIKDSDEQERGEIQLDAYSPPRHLYWDRINLGIGSQDLNPSTSSICASQQEERYSVHQTNGRTSLFKQDYTRSQHIFQPAMKYDSSTANTDIHDDDVENPVYNFLDLAQQHQIGDTVSTDTEPTQPILETQTSTPSMTDDNPNSDTTQPFHPFLLSSELETLFSSPHGVSHTYPDLGKQTRANMFSPHSRDIDVHSMDAEGEDDMRELIRVDGPFPVMSSIRPLNQLAEYGSDVDSPPPLGPDSPLFSPTPEPHDTSDYASLPPVESPRIKSPPHVLPADFPHRPQRAFSPVPSIPSSSSLSATRPKLSSALMSRRAARRPPQRKTKASPYIAVPSLPRGVRKSDYKPLSAFYHAQNTTSSSMSAPPRPQSKKRKSALSVSGYEGPSLAAVLNSATMSNANLNVVLVRRKPGPPRKQSVVDPFEATSTGISASLKEVKLKRPVEQLNGGKGDDVGSPLAKKKAKLQFESVDASSPSRSVGTTSRVPYARYYPMKDVVRMHFQGVPQGSYLAYICNTRFIPMPSGKGMEADTQELVRNGGREIDEALAKVEKHGVGRTKLRLGRGSGDGGGGGDGAPLWFVWPPRQPGELGMGQGSSKNEGDDNAIWAGPPVTALDEADGEDVEFNAEALHEQPIATETILPPASDRANNTVTTVKNKAKAPPATTKTKIVPISPIKAIPYNGGPSGEGASVKEKAKPKPAKKMVKNSATEFHSKPGRTASGTSLDKPQQVTSSYKFGPAGNSKKTANRLRPLKPKQPASNGSAEEKAPAAKPPCLEGHSNLGSAGGGASLDKPQQPAGCNINVINSVSSRSRSPSPTVPMRPSSTGPSAKALGKRKAAAEPIIENPPDSSTSAATGILDALAYPEHGPSETQNGDIPEDLDIAQYLHGFGNSPTKPPEPSASTSTHEDEVVSPSKINTIANDQWSDPGPNPRVFLDDPGTDMTVFSPMTDLLSGNIDRGRFRHPTSLFPSSTDWPQDDIPDLDTWEASASIQADVSFPSKSLGPDESSDSAFGGTIDPNLLGSLESHDAENDHLLHSPVSSRSISPQPPPVSPLPPVNIPLAYHPPMAIPDRSHRMLRTTRFSRRIEDGMVPTDEVVPATDDEDEDAGSDPGQSPPFTADASEANHHSSASQASPEVKDAPTPRTSSPAPAKPANSACKSTAPPSQILWSVRPKDAQGNELPFPERTNSRLRPFIWPSGPSGIFCHQCRNKPSMPFMHCTCAKHFCMRCIMLRYDDQVIAFDASAKNRPCPHCMGICNCTSCCAKRHETYFSARTFCVKIVGEPDDTVPISLPKKPKPKVPVAKDDINSSSRTRPQRVHLGGKTNLPPPSSLAPRPMPEPEFPLVPVSMPAGPLTFWGTIYGISGAKVATGFTGTEGDRAVVVVQPITVPNGLRTETQQEPRASENHRPQASITRHVFIGEVQPSWGLGPDPHIVDWEPGGDSVLKSKSKSTKWKGKGKEEAGIPCGRRFIGDRSLLYAKCLNSEASPSRGRWEEEGSKNLGWDEFRDESPLSPVPSDYNWVICDTEETFVVVDSTVKDLGGGRPEGHGVMEIEKSERPALGQQLEIRRNERLERSESPFDLDSSRRSANLTAQDIANAISLAFSSTVQ